VISLTPPFVTSCRSVESTFAIIPDGTAVAHSRIQYDGPCTLMARSSVAEKGPRGFARGLLADRFPGVVVDSQKVFAGDGADAPLVLELWYHVPGFACSNASIVRVPSAHLDCIRSMPVPAEPWTKTSDLEPPVRCAGEVELSWSDGFLLAEAPAATFVRTHGLTFETSYAAADGSLRTTRTLEVRAPRVDPSGIPRLREFFSYVIEADGAEVVLRRSS
jgi:hypothetical protein